MMKSNIVSRFICFLLAFLLFGTLTRDKIFRKVFVKNKKKLSFCLVIEKIVLLLEYNNKQINKTKQNGNNY